MSEQNRNILYKALKGVIIPSYCPDVTMDDIKTAIDTHVKDYKGIKEKEIFYNSETLLTHNQYVLNLAEKEIVETKSRVPLKVALEYASQLEKQAALESKRKESLVKDRSLEHTFTEEREEVKPKNTPRILLQKK